MSQSYSIAEAKNRLPEIVRSVEHDSAIQLTRRGRPVAYMISARQYESLQNTRISFWDAYRSFRKGIDDEKLDLDVETVFAEVRDQTPGREARW